VGCRVWGVGCRVQGTGCRVCNSGFGVLCLGFMVQGQQTCLESAIHSLGDLGVVVAYVLLGRALEWRVRRRFRTSVS
jgi:hypothetical protein